MFACWILDFAATVTTSIGRIPAKTVAVLACAGGIPVPPAPREPAAGPTCESNSAVDGFADSPGKQWIVLQLRLYAAAQALIGVKARLIALDGVSGLSGSVIAAIVTDAAMLKRRAVARP